MTSSGSLPSDGQRSSNRHSAQPDGYKAQPDGYPAQPDGYPAQPNGHRSAPPKLIALDLDGTVVPYSEGFIEPSSRLRAAIARAVSAGAVVTVATGRAVWNALPTVEALGLRDIELVCSNGAVVYDVASAKVLFRALFDPRPAAYALLEHAPDAGFAVEYEIEGYLHTPNFEPDPHSILAGEVSFEDLISRPTSRMVCRLAGDGAITPETPLDALRSRRDAAHSLVLRADLNPEVYAVELGFSGWIDIVAPGTSKGTALAALAARLGITAEETMAVGDGSNDLPMFAWAGYSVAMGQASDAVKAAADDVTGTIEDDGAAEVLESWF